MAERLDTAPLRALLALLAPARRLVRPAFFGFERLPRDRPLLFVGNHTLYGVLDVPFLFAELHERHGITLRALGDHVHFRIPIWRDLLRRVGAVDGTRSECARLMREGEAILVFPGGAREVSKRKGERYRLVWKERLGFARMAVEHGATIVPFSAVGVDDAFDVIVDADEIFASPIGPLLRALQIRSDAFLPLAVPRTDADRLYFKLGSPIRARDFSADVDDEAGVRHLRDAVRDAVIRGLDELHEIRAHDPDRRLVRRRRGGRA